MPLIHPNVKLDPNDDVTTFPLLKLNFAISLDTVVLQENFELNWTLLVTCLTTVLGPPSLGTSIHVFEGTLFRHTPS